MLTFIHEIDSVAVDADSVKMSDPTGTYGMRETDNSTVVVADGTDWTKTATGTYQFDDQALSLEEGVAYDYWVEVVYEGETTRFQQNLTPDPNSPGVIQISPVRSGKGRTWRFNSPEQVSATNKIIEVVGFVGNLSMDFTEPMPEDDSLLSASVLSISPSGILVVSRTLVDLTKTKAIITVSMDADDELAGEYICTIKGVTVDSQQIIRRGILLLETFAGT
jgi:hypothetical protein